MGDFVSPVRIFRRTDNGKLATPEQVQEAGVGGAGICRPGDPIPPGPLQEEVKQLLAELGLPEEAAVPREEEPSSEESKDASGEAENKDASGDAEDKAQKKPRRSLLKRK